MAALRAAAKEADGGLLGELLSGPSLKKAASSRISVDVPANEAGLGLNLGRLEARFC